MAMTVAIWVLAIAIILNTWKGMTMSAVVERLTQSVTNLTSVTDSASALIASLAQEIRDNATDEAALRELADRLDSESAELSAAVTANTPADDSSGGESPAPTPEPTPAPAPEPTPAPEPAPTDGGTTDAGAGEGGDGTTTDTPSS